MKQEESHMSKNFENLLDLSCNLIAVQIKQTDENNCPYKQ